MILLAKPLTQTPRWLQAVALVGILAILPLGIAQAGEPDYEAVANRLVEAVKAGELSADQAEAMMGGLVRARFQERMAVARAHDRLPPKLMALRKKLGAAVQAGKLSKTDAKAKFEAYARELRASEHDGERGHDGKREHADGLVGHFERLGVSGETVAGIRERLVGGGLSEEKAEKALGGLLRLVHQMKEEGDRFRPDPRLVEFFKEEVGLTDEQLEEGLGLARRLAHASESRAGDDQVAPSREEMAEVKAELDAAVEAGMITELDAEMRWRSYLQSVRGDAEQAPGDKPTPEEIAKIKERIWAAVEAGAMTEEQAQARFDAYLKSLESPRRR